MIIFKKLSLLFYVYYKNNRIKLNLVIFMNIVSEINVHNNYFV
jgi:hypothetical protein